MELIFNLFLFPQVVSNWLMFLYVGQYCSSNETCCHNTHRAENGMSVAFHHVTIDFDSDPIPRSTYCTRFADFVLVGFAQIYEVLPQIEIYVLF